MATQSIVPQASGEGGIGTATKLMGPSYFSESGLSKDVRHIEATVQTTSATPTVIWSSDSLNLGDALNVLVNIVGCDPSSAAYCGGYLRWYTVRCRAAGTTILGTDILGTDNESTVATTADVTAAVVGSALEISVTGVAGITMEWIARIEAVYRR